MTLRLHPSVTHVYNRLRLLSVHPKPRSDLHHCVRILQSLINDSDCMRESTYIQYLFKHDRENSSSYFTLIPCRTSELLGYSHE